MRCLICQEEVNQMFLFSQFFLLKTEELTACSSCYESFEEIGEQHCLRCFKPNQEDVCIECLTWERKGYDIQHHSLYKYNEAMRSYFQSYKFQGDYTLRYVFGKVLKDALKAFKDYHFIPVPVSLKTYEERGFNQVEGLLEAAGCSYKAILAKEEETKQSHLGRQERLKMKNHYYLKETEPLPKKLLLIDDIYTTGATIVSIKQLLLESGAKEVRSFSLCR